jgi:hypothetical protein
LNAGNYRFLKLLAEFERREGYARMGIAWCAHWLNWKCGIGLIAAREKCRVARALEHLPLTSDSMRRGAISYCKVRALTRVAAAQNEKENVIMGRLIPAGTGLPAYKRLDVLVEDAVGVGSTQTNERQIAAAANEES